MTREELKTHLEACATRKSKRARICAVLATTVAEIPDAILNELNATIDRTDAKIFESAKNCSGETISLFNINPHNPPSNATEFVQLCIDEADPIAAAAKEEAEMEAEEFADEMEVRKRARLPLTHDELADRLTACANLCYSELRPNDPDLERKNRALKYSIESYLTFAKTLANVSDATLKSFNDTRYKTGVAVFTSDTNQNPFPPERDKFELWHLLGCYLSEIQPQTATGFLQVCVRIMKENSKSEFYLMPPKVQEAQALMPPEIETSPSSQLNVPVIFGKRKTVPS